MAESICKVVAPRVHTVIQVSSLPKDKRSVNASHMITYHMPFNGSNNNYRIEKRLFLRSTSTKQQSRVFLNSSPDYFFTEAVSSSFRTNFLLRASEIKLAESSSLRDVQPLLYLQGHPIKKQIAVDLKP